MGLRDELRRTLGRGMEAPGWTEHTMSTGFAGRAAACVAHAHATGRVATA
jgi:hypothetical protein